MRKTAISCTATLLAAAMALLWSASAQAAPAISYRVIHAFCQTISCGDGELPAGQALALDPDGNLYGTTPVGGRYGNGTIYQLFPKHGGARYFKHVLKAFCQDTPCPTGGAPSSGVIRDTAGNLYGTTPANSETICGTIYEAVPSGGKTELKVLHRFDSSGGDGCDPNFGTLEYQGKDTGQPYDGTSPLFGAADKGGAYGHGAIYQLSPPKPGRKAWQETILYSFCASTGCPDGQAPSSNLVMDASGDLYGATLDGKVFECRPNGGFFICSTIWLTTSGEEYGQLAIKSDGTLIGVAPSGGPHNGTLYSLTPDGSGGFNYALLHDFCAGGGSCSDGVVPGTVLIDATGNIFGVTAGGGANAAPSGSPFPGGGVLFEYSSGGTYSVLHNFCSETNCTDGGTPDEGLVRDGNGNFFGTTALGGPVDHNPNGLGVAYELSF